MHFNNGGWRGQFCFEGKVIKTSNQRTEEAAAHALDMVRCAALGGSCEFLLPDLMTDRLKLELAGKPVQQVLEDIRSASAVFSKGRSVYRGVAIFKEKRNEWVGQPCLPGGKQVKVYCSTEEQAARVFDRCQVMVHGRDAAKRINFPLEDYLLQDGTPGPHARRLPQEEATLARNIPGYTPQDPSPHPPEDAAGGAPHSAGLGGQLVAQRGQRRGGPAGTAASIGAPQEGVPDCVETLVEGAESVAGSGGQAASGRGSHGSYVFAFRAVEAGGGCNEHTHSRAGAAAVGSPRVSIQSGWEQEEQWQDDDCVLEDVRDGSRASSTQLCCRFSNLPGDSEDWQCADWDWDGYVSAARHIAGQEEEAFVDEWEADGDEYFSNSEEEWEEYCLRMDVGDEEWEAAEGDEGLGLLQKEVESLPCSMSSV